MVLLEVWLSCLNVTLKGKGFVKSIEVDGGAFIKAMLETYLLVQMGLPTGVLGVRSLMIYK